MLSFLACTEKPARLGTTTANWRSTVGVIELAPSPRCSRCQGETKAISYKMRSMHGIYTPALAVQHDCAACLTNACAACNSLVVVVVDPWPSEHIRARYHAAGKHSSRCRRTQVDIVRLKTLSTSPGAEPVRRSSPGS